MSQGSFKGVPRKNLGYFKEISRVFQESHKGDSRKIEGCFNGVLSGIQRCLQEVQWVLEESFKVVSRMFQGSFKGVPTKIEGCSQIPPRELQVSVSKRSSKVFQVSFKAVSKTF